MKNKCNVCGREVDEIIGCPNGAELCQDCFDGNGEEEYERRLKLPTLIHLPSGRIRLRHPDGTIGSTVLYERTAFVWGKDGSGYAAVSGYYGEETVYQLMGVVEHNTEDRSLG